MPDKLTAREAIAKIRGDYEKLCRGQPQRWGKFANWTKAILDRVADEPYQPQKGCRRCGVWLTGKGYSFICDDCYSNAADEPKPEPEPVEPVDWPTEPGAYFAWDADNRLYEGIAFGVIDTLEDLVFLDCGGLYHHKNKYKRTLVRFVGCTVPPIKEPEPEKKPKPLLLKATLYTDGNEDWLHLEENAARINSTWRSHGTLMTFRSDQLLAVDREASDPEALEIYDREKEGE